MFIYNVINKMDDNEFENYHVKIFNKHERKTFNLSLNYHYYNISKIPMVYMPKMDVTTNNLPTNKMIYYFSNYRDKTLNFNEFINKRNTLLTVKQSTKYNNETHHGFCLTASYCFEKVHNEMMKYIQNTYIKLKHIFMDDIAKYIFSIYVDIIFN